MRIEVPIGLKAVSQMSRPSRRREAVNRVVQMPNLSEVFAAQLAQQGRAAWAYLHTSEETPDVIVPKFEAMIPSYGCSCRNDYEKIKTDHPFDYSSPDAFFVSTVVLHNLVNQKLIDAGDTTKQIMSIEEARQVWNRPAPTDRA